MGEGFTYRLTKEVTLDDLRRIRQTVGDSFNGFVDFNPEETQRAYLGPLSSLPKLEDLRGITFLDVTTTGHLSTKKDPWPTFNETIDRGSQLASVGVLHMMCGFEERSSKQTRRGYDSVAVQNCRGRLFFSYSANGSKVSTDQVYKQSFMDEMIRTVGLPLILQEKSGSFILTHSRGGELNIMRAYPGGLAPESFWCELPGESPRAGLEKLKIFLDRFATEKRFTYEWMVRRDYGEVGWAQKEPELSRKIYALLLVSELPADSYDLDMEFSLREIDGLEVVRGFLGPKDKVFSRLCSFDLSKRNYGEFAVITSSKGHQLELTLRLPDGLPLVEETIGLKFHEA